MAGKRVGVAGESKGGRQALLGFAVVVGLTVLFAGGISTAQPKVLTLKAFDNFFKPKDITLKAGEATIVLSNEGKDFHNFLLHAPGDKYLGAIPGLNRYISPGTSAENLRPGPAWRVPVLLRASPGRGHDRTDCGGEIV